MSVRYMHAITERYRRLGYAPYRWFSAADAPAWQPLRKPLAALRIGMLSTCGAYALGQRAYHHKDDASIREISSACEDGNLRFSHLTENYLASPRRDPACIFPLRTLRALVAEGIVGSLAAQVLSCMGAVYSQRRVRDELAPALLAAFGAQQVDAALLVPM